MGLIGGGMGQMGTTDGGYVLITAAHNERDFINKTYESVVSQSLQPLKWIIVDDASTDGTTDLLAGFQDVCPELIKYVKLERPPGRDFRNKILAFNAGLKLAYGLPYSYIGNLDADVSFEADYFANLLSRFENNPVLGIGGGMIPSFIGDTFVDQDVASDSVAGAVQLFRRECFEQIGGYIPLKLGGVDAAAEIMARKNGWSVKTFKELRVREHRRTGSATADPLRACMKDGMRLYSLGYGFLFFLLRCLRRSIEHPIALGSLTALYGYICSMVRKDPIVLAPDVIEYLQLEQRHKILRMVGLRRLNAEE